MCGPRIQLVSKCTAMLSCSRLAMSACSTAFVVTYKGREFYVLGMLTSAALGLFPHVLPSSGDPRLGLTVYTLLRTGRARGLNASFQGNRSSLPFENSFCIVAVDTLQRGGR